MPAMPQTAEAPAAPPQPSPLPPGWAWTTLGEVGEMFRGVTYTKGDASESPREGFLPILRANNITPKGFLCDQLVYVPARLVHDTQRIRANDIVIATSSGSISVVGKAAQARQDMNAGFGAFCAVFRSSVLLEERFVGHFFSSPAYRSHIQNVAQGVNINNLKRAHIEKLPFPLPPLPEQRRIVARIEELFSKLDAGTAELRRTQALLKRYRQSLLHAAVTGELSREWRAQNPGGETGADLLARILEERRERWAQSGKRGKYQEPQGPDAAGLPEVPEGWVWASVEQLTWDAGYGTSVKCSYENEGPPVLRIPNIVRGSVALHDLKFAPSEAPLKTSEALQPGDLLLIRTNGSKDLIGRAAVVHEKLDVETHFASYLIRLRLLSGSTFHAWTSTVWSSHYVRQWMDTNAASSAGQHNISMGKLEGLALPLPPLPEQSYIVSEVERRLSILDNMEATVSAELRRAEATRQSILHRAFTGGLVPQDPADEPASVLLERLQAEKLKVGAVAIRTGGGRRGRKPKAQAETRLLE